MNINFRKDIFIFLLCLFSFSNAWGGDAKAHPHIFVDASMILNFEQDKLMSIQQRWEFGEMFSMTLLEDYDENADGKYSEKELKTLKFEAFDNLAESEYFTHMSLNGEKYNIGKVVDFNAINKDGVVSYDFTLKLSSPLNINDLSSTNIGLYDPEYYIDIAYSAKNKVTFNGISEGLCTFKVKEDKENPTYFGMVFPRKVYFSCKNM